MLTKYTPGIVGLTCVIAFIASHTSSLRAQDPDQFKALIAQLYDRPLRSAQLKQFKQAGTPALDAVLDDFAASQFVRKIQDHLGKGFNLGRAIDQDVYASNVVRVAEAFGTAGVKELVSREPADVVKDARLKSAAFRKLGAGAIKPLLGIEIIRTFPQGDEPRVKAWVSTFTDTRKTRNVISPSVDQAWLGSVFGNVSNAVAANCCPYFVFHYDCIHVGSAPLRADTPGGYWMEQISPAERRKIQLSQLNPGASR